LDFDLKTPEVREKSYLRGNPISVEINLSPFYDKEEFFSTVSNQFSA
jgi:hypothetical protein